jgi:hypothetical protein
MRLQRMFAPQLPAAGFVMSIWYGPPPAAPKPLNWIADAELETWIAVDVPLPLPSAPAFASTRP